MALRQSNAKKVIYGRENLLLLLTQMNRWENIHNLSHLHYFPRTRRETSTRFIRYLGVLMYVVKIALLHFECSMS